MRPSSLPPSHWKLCGISSPGCAKKSAGQCEQPVLKALIEKLDPAKLLLGPVTRGLRPRAAAQRNLRLRAQHLFPMIADRIQIDILGTLRHLAVGIRRGSGHRLTYPQPIGRLITRPGKTAGIDKRLGQHRRIPIALGPVTHEPAHTPTQYVRSQIPHLYARQNQKPAITHNLVQMGTSSRFRPANVPIALLQTPLRSAESKCADPSVPRAFDQIPNLSTT